MAGGQASRTGPLMEWGAMGIYGSDGAIETLEIEPLSGHPSRLSVTAQDGAAEIAGLKQAGRRDLWLDELVAVRHRDARRHPGTPRLRRHPARRRLH